MQASLDVMSDNQGEHVRRAQARDMSANVVQAIFRLCKQATLHAADNQAVVRQVEDSAKIINEYGQRTGSNVSILFAHGSIFVGGQLLKANRGIYEGAIELGELLKKFGYGEMAIAKDVRSADLFGFVTAVADAHRGNPAGLARPGQKIILRAVSEAALKRGLTLERLDEKTAIIRTYSSAIVIMRRFYENLMKGHFELPQRIKRIAQGLVDLSQGETPAFLGVTAARNANHDDAGKAVNTAILSVSIARQICDDIVALVRVAMAALLFDTARPRLTGIQGSNRVALIPRLGEQQMTELPAATAVVLTTLGRVNEPSVMRTVIAYEAHWVAQQAKLGPLYGGLRHASLQARIVSIARAFNDMLTPDPGHEPMSADQAIAQLETERTDPQDHTVIRLLVSALGIFPTGTLVELSTGEMALVISTPAHPALYSQPRVRIVFDPGGTPTPRQYEVNLAEPPPGHPPRSIRRIVAPADENARAQARTPLGGHAAQPQAQGPAHGHHPTDHTPHSQLSRPGDPASGGYSSPDRSPSHPSYHGGSAPSHGGSAPFTPSGVHGSGPSAPHAHGQSAPGHGHSAPGHSAPGHSAPGHGAPGGDPYAPYGQPPHQQQPPQAGYSQAPQGYGAYAPPNPGQQGYGAPQATYPQQGYPPPPGYQPQAQAYAPPGAPGPHGDGYPPAPNPQQAYPAHLAPSPLPPRPDPAQAGYDAQWQAQQHQASQQPPPQPYPAHLAPSPVPPPPDSEPDAATQIARPGDAAAAIAAMAASADDGASQEGATRAVDAAQLLEQVRRTQAEEMEAVQAERGPDAPAPQPAAQPAAEAEAPKGEKQPTAEGTLTRTPLVHLLIYMLDQQLTGTTVFQTPEGASHGVYFDKGVPSKVRTHGIVAPLDRVLIELGYVDEQTLRGTLMEVVKKKVLHGRHLVNKGHLDGGQIMRALRRQLVKKLVYLFELAPETSYAYYQDENLLEDYGGPELTPCEPLALIMTGVRLRSSDPLVDATLSRLGTRRLGLHIEAEMSRFELNRDEAAVVDLMRVKRMSLDELCHAGVAHEKVVRTTLYALAVTRHLDLGVAGKSPVGTRLKSQGGAVADPPPSQPREQAPPPQTPSPAPAEDQNKKGLGIDFSASAGQASPAPAQAAPPPSAPQHAPPPPQQASPAQQPAPAAYPPAQGGYPQAPPGQGYAPPPAQQAYPQAPPAQGSYPQAPPQQPSPPQPQAAYPPAQGYAPAPPAQGSYPQAAPAQGSYPQAPPHGYPQAPPAQGSYPQAPPAQGSYPQAPSAQPSAPAPQQPVFAPSVPPQAPPVARPQPPPAPPARPSAPVAPAAPQRSAAPAGKALTPELEERRREIQEKADTVDSQDYFQMLGVDKDADMSAIQTAYFKLAKRFHPDRLPSELQDMKPLVSKLFTRYNEANATLSDPVKKLDYERLIKAGGGTPDDAAEVQRVVDAALEYQKAEVLLKKHDLAGAEALARNAAEADPDQPEYMTLLAWIQAQRRGEPPPLPEGRTSTFYDDIIKVFDDVLAKEPQYERALFWRGQLLKRSGRHDKALRDFRMVAQLNPKNIDAVREVRLSQMRTRNKSKDESGFLGKLFKK